VSTPRPRRSAAPWLFGLALLLGLLSPVVFLGVLVTGDGPGDLLTAVAATLADLAAATLAAVLATVLLLRRGVTWVRTAVTGHPQGRAGRLADDRAARWRSARERFAALCTEWTAFEADRGAVLRRPALADVSVPATARFVDAYHGAQVLLPEAEHVAARRCEFAEAVDRAVHAWREAQRVADGLAVAHDRG
jgi:hypothetical protein